ncbi:acyltransferase [Synechococcus sp. Cruz-9H2]|uniref:acyltransferase n=1 Tax=unclassified Synechococcus TaxID=2626047 RepID=UPI0020CE8E05|nr:MULTISPECIES: acyltransferase [unclassified Synechococcus]MCP9819743.1 acyltransferase [Synechococcus sp. Cruz-9H2]MCP9844191.1 acyltransferase [Synechococcus sp. Edmonson 11F2]MCP9856173.1 acyltransferase [Synechococcus sp. Cruz-9C9]MCP9863458.1 acyltransferase [Synechococcus sp. Cruz-7E5]MCP9870654.1 acyltransferase [Synechococcus sp. Cruz-7B9]
MDIHKSLRHDWYNQSLPKNIEIGESSWLYSSYAFLHFMSQAGNGVQVGSNTGLYDGTFFDLGPKASISIGSYCTLVGVIICSNQRVEIGDYCFLAHEVVIADSEVAIPMQYGWNANSVGTRPRKKNHTSRDGNTIKIGDNVWLGTGSRVLSGANIGNNSVVAAGCTVDFPIPSNAVVAGDPARVVKVLRDS